MSTVSVRYEIVTGAELNAELSRQAFYKTFAGQNTRENMDRFMQEQFSRKNWWQKYLHPAILSCWVMIRKPTG